MHSELDMDDKYKGYTQSIQLLRDSYFRLCEAYMNDAITAADYDIQMRRYQQYMIALLSIESLTRTVKAPQIILTNDKSTGKTITTSITSTTTRNENIASTVKSLVEKVLDSDYYGQLCWSLFTKPQFHTEKNQTSPQIIDACTEFFKIKNENLRAGTSKNNVMMSVKSIPSMMKTRPRRSVIEVKQK